MHQNILKFLTWRKAAIWAMALLNWNILGCIAKEYGKQREKLDLDCTTPWSQSAIGNHDYSDDKPCNDTQFNKELA